MDKKMSIFAFSLAVIGIIVIILGLTGIIPGPTVNIGNEAKVTATGTQPSLPINVNQDQVQVREITESSQNSSTTVNIPEDAVFISGTWYFDGSLPDLGSARITLSFDNYGIFEIHAKTGYGSEIIMGYGGYYVKGNTVYTSVENTNNYEATMKITSNGDIIFGEITSNGDIIFGEKKFKKYRRR